MNLTDYLAREPYGRYAEKRETHISSHQLAVFRRSPAVYLANKGKYVESNAYAFGRAAHTLILEGEISLRREYAIGGPVNPKTGRIYGSDTKAYAEWIAEQGRPAISQEQLDTLMAMNDSVRKHKTASGILCAGMAEGVIRCDIAGMPCQGRFDWVANDPGVGIADLKTCADLDEFERDCRRYEYVHQLAFYRMLMREVSGYTAPCYVIAVEKAAPYRCGVWIIYEPLLDQAERENLAALARLRQCLTTGHFPTGFEELRVYDRL
jgi:hypothetical protein